MNYATEFEQDCRIRGLTKQTILIYKCNISYFLAATQKMVMDLTERLHDTQRLHRVYDNHLCATFRTARTKRGIVWEINTAFNTGVSQSCCDHFFLGKNTPLRDNNLNKPVSDELWYFSTSFFPCIFDNFHCSVMILTSYHSYCTCKHVDYSCEYVHHKWTHNDIVAGDRF